jgi:hypothetical protein
LPLAFLPSRFYQTQKVDESEITSFGRLALLFQVVVANHWALAFIGI